MLDPFYEIVRPLTAKMIGPSRVGLWVTFIMTLGLIQVLARDESLCPPGQELAMSTEKNCAGVGWSLHTGDPGSLKPWCKTRNVPRCVPNDPNPSKVKDQSICRVKYVKDCKGSKGPTRCIVVPMRDCSLPIDSASQTWPYRKGIIGSDSKFVPIAAELKNKVGKVRCQLQVKYVRECKEGQSPSCQMVPVHEEDCAGEAPDLEDVEEDEVEHDGMSQEDIEVAMAKKQLPQGECKMVHVNQCQSSSGREYCKVVARKVCSSEEETDGKDDGEASKPSPFMLDKNALNSYLKYERPFNQKTPERPYGSNKEVPLGPDESYGSEEVTYGADGSNIYESEAFLATDRLYDTSASLGSSSIAYNLSDDFESKVEYEVVNNELEPQEEYDEGRRMFDEYAARVVYAEEEPKEKKCKQVCKMVPEKVCSKGGQGGEPWCTEAFLEDCTVSSQKNEMEICHKARDEFCTAVASDTYDYKNCKYVEVYICSTEHEIDTVTTVRHSCLSVPVVTCDPVPGYPKMLNCKQTISQICEEFAVVEPVTKSNRNCETKRIKTCNPAAKSEDLIKCKKVKRNICGIMQSTVLVPDVCFQDVYPSCQVPDGATTSCKNETKKVCTCQ